MSAKFQNMWNTCLVIFFNNVFILFFNNFFKYPHPILSLYIAKDLVGLILYFGDIFRDKHAQYNVLLLCLV